MKQDIVVWPIALLAGLIFILLFTHPTASESKNRPRLVLLYATCSLNKDYMAPYNGAVHYTPNFEEFASEAAIFTKHETEVGFSGPAFASLFTGALVYHHGVYYHPERLRDENYLIAEAFRDNGYETFFWNAHSMASAELNYAQGIKPQNVFAESPADKRSLTTRDRNFKSILDRIRSHPGYSAYVQVNFTVTHSPYSFFSPVAATLTFCKNFPGECAKVTEEDIKHYIPLFERYRESFTRDYDGTVKSVGLHPKDIQTLAAVLEIAYKSDVALLDSLFGRTIDAIRSSGLLDESVIVFTSDHGEVLYKKNSTYHWTHGTLDREVVDIPLMIRLPESRTHHPFYTEVSRSIDVFPTIAGFSGIKIRSPRYVDGIDLSQSVLGKKPQPALIAYSTDGLSHPSTGTTDPNSLLVQARAGDTMYRFDSQHDAARLEVFDWWKKGVADKDLFNPKNETHRRIKKLLQLYKTNLVRGYKEENLDRSDWNAIREKLKGLGYIH